MKVLIVDDKSENLYLLESILKGSGYITISANNGAEALSLARKDIPDLIITDILMPVMDGFTLCREFKKDEKLCNVPFIFYTATYTDPRDEELAFNLGADRFLPKPQDPDEFIAIVKDLLKEAKKQNTQTTESPSTPETIILKEYNEALVRKLEDKMLKLEQSEKEIRKNNILLLKEIEERKRAEELLQKSEERFHSLYENSTIGLYRTTPDGKIILANPTLVKMLGYSSFEELASRDLAKDGFEPDYERKQFLEQIEMNDEVKGFEAAWTTKDGKVIYISESARAIRDSNGKTLFYDGTVEDITVRTKALTSLRESEERFKQISESAHEWVWEVDHNGLYTYVSAIIEELLGYKKEEIIGTKYFYDFFDPVNKEKMKQGALAAFTHKASFKDFINVNIHKDGRKITLSTSGFPILDKDDNLVGYRGVDIDITQQKLAEDALRESEERFRRLFENAIIGLYRTTPDGTILMANKILVKMLGYSSFEKLAVRNLEKDRFEQSYERKEFLEKIEKDGEINDFESTWVGQNGNKIFVRESAQAIRDSNGSTMYYDGVVEDITDRKLAEEALQESEERFRHSFDYAPSGACIVSIEGKFQKANKAFTKMIGYEENELKNFTFSDITHPDDLSIGLSQLQKMLSDESESASFEKRYIRKNTQIIWVFVTISLVRDANHQPQFFITHIIDITERKRSEEEITMLAHSLKSINECVSITDMEDKILFVNESFLNTYGYNENELIGKDINIVRSLNNPLEFVKEILPATLGGEWQGELWNRRKDGSEFQVSLSTTIIKDKDSKSLGLIGVASNITERKQAEEKLRESEERFKTIFDQAPIAIALIDKQGHPILSNLPLSKMIGYSSAELSKMKFTDFTFPEDVEKDMNQFTNLIEGKISKYSMEKRFVHKNGNLVWINLSVTMLRDENGNGHEIIGMAEDITERKQAEEMLERSEKEFRDLAESMPQMVWITRPDGWNIYFNQKWVEYTGLTLEESYGHGWNKPFHPDDKQLAWEAWQNAVNNNALYSIESRLRRADGVYNWFLVRGIPIMDSDGTILKWFGTCTDINEIKYAEQELILAKEKAEEMNRLKSNFLANMSHELRTPLMGILGYADFLRQDAESEEKREMAETIYKSGKRLSETLNLILDLSRFETEKTGIKYQKVDLVSKAKEIISLFNETANKKGLSLISSFSQDSIIINFEERTFHSILNNLINNAIKFTSEGSITITISLINDIVEIKVIDTGIGIAEMDYKTIFEEFRQVSEGYNRNFEGSGLGLNITKKLVEKFGGTITVESEIEKGTTFKVILPVMNIEETQKELTTKEIGIVPKSPKLKSIKPIALLVDDDSFVFTVLKRYASEYIELETTVDADFAIKMLKKKHYDLIFMDINLSRGMDGKEATKKIRTIKGYESIPIIATTAYAMLGDKEEFLTAGCTHYLSKPFSQEEIVSLLEEVLKLI